MGVAVNGSRTDFRSDRLDATTGTKPFGKSKCHYTGGKYFDKIQIWIGGIFCAASRTKLGFQN